MNPWPVEADVPEVHLPRPGHADLAGVVEVRLQRRPQRARARQRARDRGARRRRRARQGVPARGRRRGRLPRHADRLGAARPSATTWRSPTSPTSTSRRSAASTPRRRARWSRRSTCCASATSRSAAIFELRAFGLAPGPRLARLLGGAAGRPHRHGAALDPGAQGRRARRRLRPRGPPGLRGPRRDLLRRRARLLPRDEPLGRPRGRHDDRRAAGRALRDEAAADADQAAALRRHRDARARPGAARADRLRAWCPPRAWWGRRCSRSCSPAPTGEKFGGDHIDDVLAALAAYEERIGWKRRRP